MMTASTSEVELEMLLSSASSSATTAAEELIKYVLMTVPAVLSIRVLALSMSLQTLITMLVIDLFLFGVAESLVGVCDILEFLFCTLWIILVFIRVKFNRKFFESLLDLLICCTTFKSQNAV